MTLRLPEDLRRQLAEDGTAAGRTLHQQIVWVLAAHYGREAQVPRRGRRPKGESIPGGAVTPLPGAAARLDEGSRKISELAAGDDPD
jgi:hypothetical protein